LKIRALLVQQLPASDEADVEAIDIVLRACTKLVSDTSASHIEQFATFRSGDIESTTTSPTLSHDLGSIRIDNKYNRRRSTRQSICVLTTTPSPARRSTPERYDSHLRRQGGEMELQKQEKDQELHSDRIGC
jgi:hypothetical protein